MKKKFAILTAMMMVATIFFGTSLSATNSANIMYGLSSQDLGWGVSIDSPEERVLISHTIFTDMSGDSLTRSGRIYHSEEPGLFLAEQSVYRLVDGGTITSSLYINTPITARNGTTTQVHRREEHGGSGDFARIIWVSGSFTLTPNVSVTVSNPRGNVTALAGTTRVSNNDVRIVRNNTLNLITGIRDSEVTFSATLTNRINSSTNVSVSVRADALGRHNGNS